MLDRIVRRTWEENLLFTVLVELTYRCNLDCYFCYNDLGQRGRSLRFEQYCRLFEDLAAMQVMNLVLTGGEPLAHPHFFELGARARELGFVVRVKSNGHALRGSLARRVKEEIDPYIVEVSLHGASAAVHDRQTRVEGSFERLLRNLEEISAIGLRVKVNCTLTRWNEHELEAMFDLVDELGVDLQVDPEVTARDDGDREPLSITASREAVARLLRLQVERSRRRVAEQPSLQVARQDSDLMSAGLEAAAGPASKHCGAGSSGLAIDPFGRVLPCVQWRRPIGSLHESSISDIWNRNVALRQVRDLSTRVKTRVASLGKRGQLMAFCPGSAETQTGSALEVYPAARRRMELLSSVLEADLPGDGELAERRRSKRALPVLD